jgi:hypothetical protein
MKTKVLLLQKDKPVLHTAWDESMRGRIPALLEEYKAEGLNIDRDLPVGERFVIPGDLAHVAVFVETEEEDKLRSEDWGKFSSAVRKGAELAPSVSVKVKPASQAMFTENE